MWILKRLLSLCTQWIKKKDNTCNYLVTRIIQAIRSAEELFVDRNKIVTMKSLDNWVSVYGCLACEAAEDKVKKLWIARRYKQLKDLLPVYTKTKECLHKRAEEHNQQCMCLDTLSKIRTAINDASLLLGDQTGFIEPGKYHEWRDTHRDVLALDCTAICSFRKLSISSELEAEWTELMRIDKTLLEDICNKNEYVAANMANYAYEMTGQIEGRWMDKQQMQCVAMEVRNHLVIAGAGTGKTTTIIARIKYLLKTGQCKPKDILVLSYTRASANEMCKRIKKETGEKRIDVFTFHQLGRKIITQCEKNRPSICPPRLLEEMVKENIDSRGLDSCSELAGKDRDAVIRLVTTLITLMKSKGYSLEDIEKKILDGDPANREANVDIYTLLAPVYQAYQAYLTETNTMDFNDMIWRAIRLIQNQQYSHSYKYVIVDEYQDMSYAPDVLLHAMRQSIDFRLFCVGDDWQSIYRFNGSDIGYILEFEKHWGPAQISKIETTYRFSQQLVNISGRFIMKNKHQYPKKMVGKGPDCEGFALEIIRDNLYLNAIDGMIKKLGELPAGSTVFVLGRYKHDKDALKHFPNLHVRENAESETIIVYPKRPDLKISFLTVHKAKGLQADFVFIINNRQGKTGFPSHQQDPPIIGQLLNSREAYPFAEERRLFYVALTRAKKKVYLVLQNDNVSEFAKELIHNYSREIASKSSLTH